jgi:glycerol uptake facilitator-like aquaporin
MIEISLARRLVAESLGTALLVATVVGSGIMGAKLSPDNQALALLCNTLPTGAILVVLISILGPVSGAHFNPAVSLVMALRKDQTWQGAALYSTVQVIGACVGSLVAHAMFGVEILQTSATLRSGGGLWFSEFVATFVLIGAIIGGLRNAPDAIPWLVGLTITAAYWFTASTSFANPAVTIGRSLTNSFAGIAPSSVLAFILVQICGALLGWLVWGWLFRNEKPAA